MIYIMIFSSIPPLKKNQDPHLFVDHVTQKRIYSEMYSYNLNVLSELDKHHDNETSIMCS